MAVLVIAEHDNASLNDATNKVVTAAAKFGGDVDVLVCAAAHKAAAVAVPLVAAVNFDDGGAPLCCVDAARLSVALPTMTISPDASSCTLAALPAPE